MSYQWNPVENEEFSNRARYWIYAIMRERNLSVANVDFDGVSKKTIFNFVSGARCITLEKIARIARGIGVDPLELLQPMPAKQEVFKRPDSTRGVPRPYQKSFTPEAMQPARTEMPGVKLK